MDLAKIQESLRNLVTEASRFGAETALNIKHTGDDPRFVSDEKVTEAMRKAVELIITEHNLSLGPVKGETLQ